MNWFALMLDTHTIIVITLIICMHGTRYLECGNKNVPKQAHKMEHQITQCSTHHNYFINDTIVLVSSSHILLPHLLLLPVLTFWLLSLLVLLFQLLSWHLLSTQSLSFVSQAYLILLQDVLMKATHSLFLVWRADMFKHAGYMVRR